MFARVDILNIGAVKPIFVSTYEYCNPNSGWQKWKNSKNFIGSMRFSKLNKPMYDLKQAIRNQI